MNPKDLENAILSYNAYRKVWKERKYKCVDFINTIADSMNKRTRDVMVSISHILYTIYIYIYILCIYYIRNIYILYIYYILRIYIFFHVI